MSTNDWLNDLYDDVVMERGVDYEEARILVFKWLIEIKEWSPKCDKMLEYLLND